MAHLAIFWQRYSVRDHERGEFAPSDAGFALLGLGTARHAQARPEQLTDTLRAAVLAACGGDW